MGSDSNHKAKAASSTVGQWATALLCGFLLGTGVGLGGMTDARKTSAFFNLSNWGTKFFDPALLITFVAALVTNTVLYYGVVMRKMKKPFFAPSFCIPSATHLPFSLFAGSFMFGSGWAIGGFCPGPALVASFEGNPKTLYFVAAMVVGMYMAKNQVDAETPKTGKAILSAQFALLLSFVTTGALLYRASFVPAVRQDPAEFYQSPFMPLVGGVMVGSSVSLMMALSGEILGIAGIINGLYSAVSSHKPFRVAFILGLMMSGLFLKIVFPATLYNHMQRPWYFFIVGGFLVGYGTTIGRGCTSGHGIAGVTRMSIRSIAAVSTFMLANFLVTTILKSYGIGLGWQQVLHQYI